MKHLAAFLAAMLALMAVPPISAGDVNDSNPGTFTLFQLPNQSSTQMMSYVIQTVHGKVIVIDGGTAMDAPFLAKFLDGLGGNVDTWFVTHAHNDHFDALAEILKNPGTLKIQTLCGSLPDEAWVNQWCSDSEKRSYAAFLKSLTGAGRRVDELFAGQSLDIDGVHVEVLGVKNPEITGNAINNSSVVLRMADAVKSVLFLADLGAEGGEKLMNGPCAERLPSDYVQMAHHGQQGVSEAFYAKVRPSYCLWPTPKWLWDNDKGGGVNSGPWRTLEVRAWMKKLPIKKHYLMLEGMQTIR